MKPIAWYDSTSHHVSTDQHDPLFTPLGQVWPLYAKQEQGEPVGKFAKFTDGIWREVTDGSAGVPLYTTPQQRTWVGLTDEETETLIHRFDGDPHTLLDEVNARLKEKNT